VLSWAMPKRALLWAALLLLASAAKAAEPGKRAAAKLSPRGACECLQKKLCWKLVREAFSGNAARAKTEVEAAAPERFFKGVATFALEKPDQDGHFLALQCRASACGDKLDEFERRFVVTTFLASLPLDAKRAELFDEDTWIVSEKGEKLFGQAKLCKPGLMQTLIELIHATRSN
jgi:hypothetical protein